MSDGTLLPAIGMAAGLAAVLGAALGALATRLRPQPDSLVERIDALLPQTQCGQCRYPGCRPYAQAIAAGEADNRLLPARRRLHRARAGRPARPRAPAGGSRYGVAGPRRVALIDEDRCIGCARCLPACPVDAIVGAPRLMHTVIEEQCTGCELCLGALPGRLHRDGRAEGRSIVRTVPRVAS